MPSGLTFRVVKCLRPDTQCSIGVSGKTFGGFSAPTTTKDQFGKRFIMLPNPMYGNWVGAIYDYNFNLSEAERAAKRKSQLKGY
ncbi:MAG TPA: hypothetical protein VHE60_00740 [Pyrinomonadaceae bacterium]|nr:hypothetical protein [Pyrinomonadaceae bacterium]